MEEHSPNLQFSSLVVANGLGPFSSTRIGVTIANTLQIAHPQAKLYAFTVATSADQIPPEGVINSLNKTFFADQYQNLTNFLPLFFAQNPQPLPIIPPQYTAPPKITPSKKPKFF